jgi:peptidoglycan/LPS O-acetylase OafA/YrhL
VVAFVLIAGCITGWSGGIGKFFLLPPLRYLGKISYGIFVYHLLLLFWLEPRLMPLGLGPGMNAWIWSFLLLAIVVLIAGLSFRFLEQPATSWAHRVLLPPEPGSDREKTF